MQIPILLNYPKQPRWPIFGDHIQELENGDPHYNNVTALFNASSTPGIIKDYSKYNATVTMSSSTTTTALKKYRYGSIYHNAYANPFYIAYDATKFDWWTTDYTIEGWINYSQLSSNSVPFGLIHNGTPTSGNIYWGFGQNLYNSKNGIGFCYWNGSGVQYIHQNNAPAIVTNTWYHIAFVHKKGYGIKLFINGIPHSSTWVPYTGSPSSNAGYGLVGGYRWNSGTIYGAHQDVRITKGIARYGDHFTPPTRSLPTSRLNYKEFSIPNKYIISKQVQSPVIISKANFDGQDKYLNNVVLYTKLQESYIDLSKSHKVLTPSGNTTLAYEGVYFDGASDQISIPHSSDFTVGTNDNFTVETWVKLDSISVAYFVQKGGYSGSTYSHWSIHCNGTYFTAQIGRAQATASRNIITGITPLQANRWYHCAFVKYGSRLIIYLDGKKEAEETLSITPLDSASYGITYGTYPLNTQNLTGQLCDVKITRAARYLSNFIPPKRSFEQKWLTQ